jgi:hypothetical protein
MHRTILRLAGITFVLTAGLAFGQGLGLTPAAPDGTSALTVAPEAGPWMICAASFGGQPARSQAEELATEIRTRYTLPAYVFNRTGEERRAERERVARAKDEQRKKLEQDGLPADTPIYVKTVHIEDQYAVLVGGYKDDAAARKALDAIRKLHPSEKFDRLAYVPDPTTGKVREEGINPFQSAFVCRNPTVQVEKPKQDSGPDPRLKKYNSGESYSLLKCPKPFTMVVKAYKGESVVQAQSASSSVFARVGQDRQFGSILNANANQAHQVADFLRKFGVEAYVLHTEYNSYITVGAFDSATDPRLAQMQRWFVSEMNNPSSNVGQLHMKAMVQFAPDPMPFPVPQVK